MLPLVWCVLLPKHVLNGTVKCQQRKSFTDLNGLPDFLLLTCFGNLFQECKYLKSWCRGYNVKLGSGLEMSRSWLPVSMNQRSCHYRRQHIHMLMSVCTACAIHTQGKWRAWIMHLDVPGCSRDFHITICSYPWADLFKICPELNVLLQMRSGQFRRKQSYCLWFCYCTLKCTRHLQQPYHMFCPVSL